MSDQAHTTANAPCEPRLCKMGCGFFGSGAMEDCCSKCWNSKQPKKPESAPVPAPAAAKAIKEPVAEEPTPMDVEPVLEEHEVMMESTPAPTLKKKKKKTSYKNMMAGVLKCSPERDVEKEKELLRKVTGGGAFSKIEKI